jgi:death-on-curing protein
MYLFLGLNGFRIEAPEEAVVSLILSLAAGELNETELADWVHRHINLR